VTTLCVTVSLTQAKLRPHDRCECGCLQELAARFEMATAGVASRADGQMNTLEAGSLRGQFLGGLLLGMVWSPCIGPTLGGAIALASQGENLGYVTCQPLLKNSSTTRQAPFNLPWMQGKQSLLIIRQRGAALANVRSGSSMRSAPKIQLMTMP